MVAVGLLVSSVYNVFGYRTLFISSKSKARSNLYECKTTKPATQTIAFNAGTHKTSMEVLWSFWALNTIYFMDFENISPFSALHIDSNSVVCSFQESLMQVLLTFLVVCQEES